MINTRLRTVFPLVFSGVGAVVGIAVWFSASAVRSFGLEFFISSLSLGGLLGTFIAVNRLDNRVRVAKRYSVNIIIMMIVGLVVASTDKLGGWSAPFWLGVMFLGGLSALWVPIKTNAIGSCKKTGI